MAKAWKFQNNINTDQIIPGRYYPRENVEELGEFCLCELHPKFAKEKQKGDIIVGGSNFGCGSSREYAPIALKYSGVKCIIAKSFARIFYRNCINLGFPILVCKECYDEITEGDDIDVNLESGEIKNNTSGKKYNAQPLPEFVLKIVDAGGMINYLKEQANSENTNEV
ncbi:3-isopropylmalate dehydratase small subunit [Candidatus Woesearchaeota archaeon]|nr:3-isopropylmalate dehydratase small subunit [Candidatus Woesearchaeota archaeon]MBT5272743.1 3-isopropylmalate dehydratase small subunit [Candidatus Woesearchaeota archaeon]MBT6040354.1 3-isopropylmalate dehydratase small subunit [Candidatus Woesearchaeota archaeon]MBT6337012.1 3-isopropylmalate dehydratase small subunit [Candidatus Woesearchaeota archaeon]MBT7926898.1 3-isopropylmalate dehydratase small subunit [Candidatus Woesearchaeota archaeon]